MDWDSLGADWPHRNLSRFVETRAARWHVQRGGAGPRMLLLHGAGASTHSWRGMLPLLLGHADVLALDLPGHGFTKARSASRSGLPRMAEDIQALLDQEGFEPDTIVGHSAGAAIALQMARSRPPARILGLNPALMPFQGVAGVLFPPLAKLLAFNPLTAQIAARTATERSVRALLEGTGSHLDAEGQALYKRLISAPSHVDGALQMMARWQLEPLLEVLPGLALPVSFAIGSEDRTVPPETTRRQAKRMPSAQIIEIPGEGHLMHETTPAPFAEMALGRSSE